MVMQLPQSSRKLTSWKEVAAFFGRGERTVKRWEAERGLPIRRLPGRSGAGIYADTDELRRWLTQAEALEPEAAAELEDADSAPGAAIPPPARPAGRPSIGKSLWLVVALGVVVLSAGAVRLAAGGRLRLAAPDAQAQELYREGVHDWNTRTPAGLNRALDEFTQSIVRDPQYAAAYAGLADCYNLLREFAAMPDSEAFPRAEAAARRAVQLDPQLARAHSALAFDLAYWRGDAAGADREFRTAVRLDPRDALAHHWFANVLKDQSRWSEALSEIDTAQALDPQSSAILADKGWILITSGRVEEGRALLRRQEKIDPAFGSPHAYLATLDLARRDYPDFFEENRQLAAVRGDADLGRLTLDAQRGWQAHGEPGMLSAMLSDALDRHAHAGGSAFDIARIYAMMGDESHCVQWLRTAIREHDMGVLGALCDPVIARVRGRPAFRFLPDALRAGWGGSPRPSSAA